MRPAVALLLLLVACPSKKSCPDLQGLERDRCYYDEIRVIPPTGAAQVQALAAKVEDPVVRAAAVYSWVLDNLGKVPRQDAITLCKTLPRDEAAACLKRMEAAHLNR